MFKQAMLAATLCLTLCLMSAVAFAQSAPAPAAQAPRPPAVKTHLKVGDMAPDFELPGTDGKTYKLSQFKGQKNVVLAVYFFAFTGG
jgi:cytochrome oxidase Cu insertion factor (SCO1/SenC/PrrC family)